MNYKEQYDSRQRVVYGRNADNLQVGYQSFGDVFLNIPVVVTQVDSNNSQKQIYCVNIFNISTRGFYYEKKFMTEAKLIYNATTENFHWVAIGEGDPQLSASDSSYHLEYGKITNDLNRSTINFKSGWAENPIVLCQILTSGWDRLYTIEVFNVNLTKFEYTKKYVSSPPNTIELAATESFYYLAIGKLKTPVSDSTKIKYGIIPADNKNYKSSLSFPSAFSNSSNCAVFGQIICLSPPPYGLYYFQTDGTTNQMFNYQKSFVSGGIANIRYATSESCNWIALGP